MIIFALNNGFNIMDVEPKNSVEDYRIVMGKEL